MFPVTQSRGKVAGALALIPSNLLCFPALKLVHQATQTQSPKPLVPWDRRSKLVRGQVKGCGRVPLLEREHLFHAVFNHHLVRVVRDGSDVKLVLSVSAGLIMRPSLTWGILAGKAVPASNQSYRQ